MGRARLLLGGGPFGPASHSGILVSKNEVEFVRETRASSARFFAIAARWTGFVALQTNQWEWGKSGGSGGALLLFDASCKFGNHDSVFRYRPWSRIGERMRARKDGRMGQDRKKRHGTQEHASAAVARGI